MCFLCDAYSQFYLFSVPQICPVSVIKSSIVKMMFYVIMAISLHSRHHLHLAKFIYKLALPATRNDDDGSSWCGSVSISTTQLSGNSLKTRKEIIEQRRSEIVVIQLHTHTHKFVNEYSILPLLKQVQALLFWRNLFPWQDKGEQQTAITCTE